MSFPSYNKDQKTVFGEDYSIKLAGGSRDERDVYEIFFYQDKSTEFYFSTIRGRRELIPGKRIPRLIDNGSYSIDRLWCWNLGCVELKENIPEDQRRIARKNILEGMMLMEGHFQKPPKKIEFARSAGGLPAT